MKKMAIVMAYLLFVMNIPTNVFAEVKSLAPKFAHKETFYANSVLQYKDKTLVSGSKDIENWSSQAYVIDSNGKKEHLKYTEGYYFLNGNEARYSDETPLELAAWNSSNYVYNFDTKVEKEIHGNKKELDKIISEIISHYEGKLGHELKDYRIVDNKELEKIKKGIKRESGIDIYVNDFELEGNYLSYSIYGYIGSDFEWKEYSGIYNNGEIYGLNEGVYVHDGIENENGIVLTTYSDTTKLYFIDNNSNVQQLIDINLSLDIEISYLDKDYLVATATGHDWDNDNYIRENYIFKKNLQNKYQQITKLNGYRVQASQNNQIYLLDSQENKAQSLYKFNKSNNKVEKVLDFDTSIASVHIYDDSIMSVIGEFIDNPNARWYGIINGQSTKDGWISVDGKWYFYENGTMVTGWKYTGGKWYFMESNGVMSTGWTKVSGKWYYLESNGQMVTGWKQVGGKWYYLESNGQMVTGWKQLGSKWYYLESNGQMVTGWKQLGSKWYYLESNGQMATGWKQLGSSWYYLESNGQMATGWKQLGSKWYYLESNGQMATGWKQLGSKWYYLESNGQMATGWKQLGSSWYYLESNGQMATGWKQLGGTWYYLYSSGVMATNTTIDGWKIGGNGIATKINGNNSSNSKSVYVTPGGKSYHSTKNCTSLKRSTNILNMTLSEAYSKGKSDPCNLCVR